MISPVYNENCKECKTNTGNTFCNLCSDPVCEKCRVVINELNCCRPCSASLRNDLNLLKSFLEWHRNNKDKLPQKYSLFDIVGFHEKQSCRVEYEDSKWIGGVTIWSSGEIEAEAIVVSNENKYFNLYRIVDDVEELNEFLNGVYDYHAVNYGYFR
jgi:hypothetical protein